MMTEFRGDCVSALRELVACKDLCDAIDRREAMRHTHNPLQLAETAVMREEYRERKAKALELDQLDNILKKASVAV